MEYGTTASYGTDSSLNSSLVTSHSVTLTGLSPSTTYDYAVMSANSGGMLATSTNFTFTTGLAPPPVITAVTATNITSSGATITWTTDQASNSQVEYGTSTSYGSLSSLNSSSVTSHSVTLTGLTASTTYDYAAMSANSGGTSATSANFTFTTGASGGGAITVTGNTCASWSYNNSTACTWTPSSPSVGNSIHCFVFNFSTTTAFSVTDNAGVPNTYTQNGTAIYHGTANAGYYALFDDLAVTNGPLTATTASVTGTGNFFGLSCYETAGGSEVIDGAVGTGSAASGSVSATINPTGTTDLASCGVSSSSNLTPGTGYTGIAPVPFSPTTSIYQVLTGSGSQTATATIAGGTDMICGTYSPSSAGPAPMITAVTATSITSSGAIITWTTDQASNSQVKYGTTTSYGSLSSLNSSLVTSHSVTLTGLAPGTTYDYAVMSANSTGTLATSANFTFPTLTVAPAISNVAATSITATSAVITWTTDQNSSSTVNYGLTTSYGSTSTGNGGTTTHSVTLTGLTPSTTYDYDVSSTNAASQSSTSGNFTFATSAAGAPSITAVTATSITSSSATITWTTDQASSSQVKYGTTTSYGSSSSLNSSLVTSHSVTLTGLTASTTYDYAAMSANSGGTLATSANFTFTTGASGGGGAITVTGNTCASWSYSNSTACTWTPGAPSVGNSIHCFVFNFSTTSALALTDNAGVGVPNTYTQNGSTYFGTASGGYYALFDDLAVTNGSLTTTTANLTGSGSFFGLSCYETAGGSEVVDGAVGTGSAPNGSVSSTINPTGTADLASCGVSSSNSITPGSGYTTIAPEPSSPTTSMYKILSASGSQTATATIASETDMICGTYSLSSGGTNVISSVTSSGVTSSGATITWTTSEASTSQVEYGTTTSYGTESSLNSSLVTSHSVTLTGLTASTTYDYAVMSMNSGGTLVTSTNFTFTTASTSPPVITAVTATNITSNGATITWTTDQASNSQVEYGTTTSYGTESSLNSSLVTSHSVTLTGLSASTTYDYAAMSANSGGTLATSANFTFTTTAAPVITAVTATSITSSGATITWTTDQASNSQVEYGTTTSYGSLSSLNNSLVTSHSVTLTGLTAGTTYDYAAMSANPAGTISTSANFTFTTGASGGGAITVTGNTCSNWTYSTSTACSWTPNPPSVGNSIHCFVFNFSTSTGFSVTDNAGAPNTYAQNGTMIYYGSANGGYYALFDDLTVTDGTLTHTTANVTGTGNFFGLSCYETSGGSKIVDGAVGTGSASSGAVSVTINPTGTTDLGSCGVSSSNNLTPGSGYTAIATAPFSPTTSMYKILTASGSQTATATIASGTDMICATYK